MLLYRHQSIRVTQSTYVWAYAHELMFVVACVHMHVGACCRGPFLSGHSRCVMRERLSLAGNSPTRLGGLARKPRDPPVSTTQRWDYRCCHHTWLFRWALGNDLIFLCLHLHRKHITNKAVSPGPKELLNTLLPGSYPLRGVEC